MSGAKDNKAGSDCVLQVNHGAYTRLTDSTSRNSCLCSFCRYFDFLVLKYAQRWCLPNLRGASGAENKHTINVIKVMKRDADRLL